MRTKKTVPEAAKSKARFEPPAECTASKACRSSVARRAMLQLKCGRGQAIVEYVIVGSACLGLVLALIVFAGRIQDGLFVEHALDSASHAAGPNGMGTVGDVLLY